MRLLSLVAYLATAALVGDAAAVVVSGALVRGAGRARHEIAAAAALRTQHASTDALRDPFRPILDRNLFGVVAKRTEGPARIEATPPSALTARYELVGTVVAANPADSRAVVRARGSDGGARTLVLGSPLDETRVVGIQQRRILIDSRGQVEALDFDLDATDGPSTEPAATAAPSPVSGSSVSRAGDGAYEIDGETFRRVGADPALLMRDARFVPATDRGGGGGWRVFAVKPGSLFAQLGLVDGDVVRAIDSTRLADLDATLAGLSALREAHAFEVTVERGQIERTLRYRVR